MCMASVFCIHGRAQNLYAQTEAEAEAPHYWETDAAAPRGVVLVVHGLNLKPSKMGSPDADGTLVHLLLAAGWHVYRVTLHGHAGGVEEMRSVTRADWLRGAYTQYNEAKAHAETARLPLYLLGFSLGALVYEVLMHEEPPVRFDKAILFSPALAIRPAAKSLLWLSPFSGDSAIIPSASPSAYRAQSGASIAAYKAVFGMEEELCAASFRNCDIKTIVFIDKDDEMISAGLLRERIARYKLTNWTIHEISASGGVIRPRYHHLLVDASCVSAAVWQYIGQTITGFLGSP